MTTYRDSRWENYTALLILLEGARVVVKQPQLKSRVLRRDFWLKPFGDIATLKEKLLADHKESAGYCDKDIPESVRDLMECLENLDAAAADEKKAEEFFVLCAKARVDCHSIVIERAWPGT